MGKAALLAIAAFAAMSTLYNGNTKRGLLKASERVANHQYSTLARSAAVNGFNLAKQALAESFSSKEFKGKFDRAVYGVAIDVSGDRATVIAIGGIPNASGDESRYRIRAEFHRQTLPPTMAESAPEFMSYTVLSEDDLRISGNAASASAYAGEGDANFHTNSNLIVDGKGHERIQGYGTYSGSARGEHRNEKFAPNGDDDTPHTSYESPIGLPDFNMDEYLTLVKADYTADDGASLSGSFAPGGTRNEPYVYHVKGDLTISDLTVDGYVLFLVDGDLKFTGNAVVGNSGYREADESSLAFYSGGSITMNGNTEVWGQMYSEGDFNIGGTSDFYGSITTAGSLRLHGNPTFHYRTASPALTTIWNGVPGGARVRLTSFFEK